MVLVADPVAFGLVGNLARPGGNITGLSTGTGPELHGKRLELLKEAVPRMSRVAVLWDPDNPGSRALGLTIPPSLLLRADAVIE